MNRSIGPLLLAALAACGSNAPSNGSSKDPLDTGGASNTTRSAEASSPRALERGSAPSGMRSVDDGVRQGRGGPGMRGHGNGPRHPSAALRDDFHALLDAHGRIERRVERRPDGVETVTTSEDPEVTAILRRHVASMNAHLAEGGRVRPWDPLFAALADHVDEMRLEVREVPGGIAVVHRGTTPEAVALIQAHADVVSGFVARGYAEAHREHVAPTP